MTYNRKKKIGLNILIAQLNQKIRGAFFMYE